MLKEIKALFKKKAVLALTLSLSATTNVGMGAYKDTPPYDQEEPDSISDTYNEAMNRGAIIRNLVEASSNITIKIKNYDQFRDVETGIQQAYTDYKTYMETEVPQYFIKAAHLSGLITGVPAIDKINKAYHESYLCKILESKSSRAQGCLHIVNQTALRTIYLTKGTDLEEFFPESSLIRECRDDNGNLCYGVYFKDSLRRDWDTEERILSEILSDPFKSCLLSDKITLADTKAYRNRFPNDQITTSITYDIHYNGRGDILNFRKNLEETPHEYAYTMHAVDNKKTGIKHDGTLSIKVTGNLPVHQKSVLDETTGNETKEWRTFQEIHDYFREERKVASHEVNFFTPSLTQDHMWITHTKAANDSNITVAKKTISRLQIAQTLTN